MSDDLDLRAIHRRHDPDPRFVAALGAHLEAIMTSSASVDVSTDEASTDTVELEAGDSQRPPAQHHIRRLFGAALVLAAASVAVFAVVTSRDRTPVDEVNTSQGGQQTNGWVAFTQADANGDRDVYLVREGEAPRRVAGSDDDWSDQVCPAFSPDGRQLLFGQATIAPRSRDGGYEDDAKLVITKVSADGSTSVTTTIPLDEVSDPPCATWSSDGRSVAFATGGFGVRTNDTREGGEVWLVDVATGELRPTGYEASDLDWRPGTDELGVADDGIHIISLREGDRSVGVEGARELAWSPDGSTIAFTRVSSPGQDVRVSLWLVDADGTNERALTADYSVVHGVGPVWSPDGRYIAYQRVCRSCSEAHEVVLVSAEDNDRDTPVGTEVVIPTPTTGDDQSVSWHPWSVTWSPDASTLLYIAWNDDPTARPEGQGILAVPVDTTKPPVVLAENTAISAYDGDPWLPVQNWGRQPPG